MIKVLFVCHGNICRSPMAEFLLKDKVEKRNISNNFIIESAGVSGEEEGNPTHRGTKNILNALGIDCSKKRARRLIKKDFELFDYIIAMDTGNIRNIERLIGKKLNDGIYKNSNILKLKDFLDGGDIADPWYTGNFELTFKEIDQCLDLFLKKVINFTEFSQKNNTN